MNALKKILATGAVVVVVLSILLIILQTAFGYIFSQLKPLVVMVIGNHNGYLTFLGTIVLAVVIIVLVGTIFTRPSIKGLFARTINRIPETIKRSRGALVQLSENSYYLVAVVKRVKIKMIGGGLIDFYILFQSSTPIPPTGMLIFAKSEAVTLLRLSFAEVGTISASYGLSAPKLIEEYGEQSTG